MTPSQQEQLAAGIKDLASALRLIEDQMLVNRVKLDHSSDAQTGYIKGKEYVRDGLCKLTAAFLPESAQDQWIEDMKMETLHLMSVEVGLIEELARYEVEQIMTRRSAIDDLGELGRA